MYEIQLIIARALLHARRPMGSAYRGEELTLPRPWVDPYELENMSDRERAELLRESHIVVSQLQSHGYNVGAIE